VLYEIFKLGSPTLFSAGAYTESDKALRGKESGYDRLGSSRKFTKHSNITHTKPLLGKQGLAQKASQTFFDNISVQRNIIESKNNRFLDFQQLAKSAHFSILILFIFILFIFI